MGLTRINNQALTDITSAGLPSGAVIQVKRYEVTDVPSAIGFTSASWTDTGHSVSITPNAVGNKLLVLVNYSMINNSTGWGRGRLALNGTAIGDIYQVGYLESSHNRYSPWACQHEHTTTNTNAHTFKTQIYSGSGQTDIHVSSSVNITVMEIAG